MSGLIGTFSSVHYVRAVPPPWWVWLIVSGSLCETTINECLSNPCLNGGSCSDLVNAFVCSCTSGHVGPRCNETACVVSNPLCMNGGTCYDNSMCFCPVGYAGSRCELTQCQAVPCVNGGTCMANGTCVCPKGYTGNQCEVALCSLVAAHCQVSWQMATHVFSLG